MTRIIFVRHGEAEGNINHRFHGVYNSSLTQNGIRQAKTVADYLISYPIDVIYSSDLSRTQNTAYYISKKCDLEVNLDIRLREIYGGDWEDMLWESLPQLYPQLYEEWVKHPHLLHTPNGESLIQFVNRNLQAVEHIVSKNIGKTICIVTHGAVIKALVCIYKGLDLSEYPTIDWYDNASVTIVDVENGKYNFVLEGYNEHLGDLSTFAKTKWWKEVE